MHSVSSVWSLWSDIAQVNLYHFGRYFYTTSICSALILWTIFWNITNIIMHYALSIHISCSKQSDARFNLYQVVHVPSEFHAFTSCHCVMANHFSPRNLTTGIQIWEGGFYSALWRYAMLYWTIIPLEGVFVIKYRPPTLGSIMLNEYYAACDDFICCYFPGHDGFCRHGVINTRISVCLQECCAATSR